MSSKQDIIDKYLEYEFSNITKEFDEESGKFKWFLNGKVVAGFAIEQKIFYHCDSIRAKIATMLSMDESDAEDVIISWFIKKFDVGDSDTVGIWGIPILDRQVGFGYNL